jgi:hypothetical protein
LKPFPSTAFSFLGGALGQMGAAAVGFVGQWLERAIKAGSLHNADPLCKSGSEGSGKGARLAMVLIARLVRFQPLLINGRLSEAPNGAAPALKSERKSRSRQSQ